MNPAKLVDGKLPAQLGICVDNGAATLVNVDGPNNFKNISTDMSAHRCTLPPLPEVVLASAGEQKGS
ncbi:hypothetical protein D9M70_575310 [compost metagenome]